MGNLQNFLGALVEHAPTNLSTAEMQYWIENDVDLAEVLAKALKPEAVVTASQEQVLEKPGRITFTVVGTGLSGTEWRARLEAGSHKLSGPVLGILLKSDYDANHRLEPGKEYNIAFVRGSDILPRNRTTSALQAIGVRDYGPRAVSELRGELALLIREKFTNHELQKMGLKYIAVLHAPINDFYGNPRVLSADRDLGNSSVDAYCDRPDKRWSGGGAFPVLVRVVLGG